MAAQDGGAASSSGRGDGADRRRRDRHAIALRADRPGRGDARGRVQNDTDRFVPEWGELLGLGEVRRQPYVSSGLVFLGHPMERGRPGADGRAPGPGRLRPYLLARQRARLPVPLRRPGRLQRGPGEPDPEEQVVALPNRLAPNPPFRGLRPIDEAGLRWAYEDGMEPYVVHHHTAKPWLEPTYDGLYSRLLRRLLGGADCRCGCQGVRYPCACAAGWPPTPSANGSTRASDCGGGQRATEDLLERVRGRGSRVPRAGARATAARSRARGVGRDDRALAAARRGHGPSFRRGSRLHRPAGTPAGNAGTPDPGRRRPLAPAPAARAAARRGRERLLLRPIGAGRRARGTETGDTGPPPVSGQRAGAPLLPRQPARPPNARSARVAWRADAALVREAGAQGPTGAQRRSPGRWACPLQRACTAGSARTSGWWPPIPSSSTRGAGPPRSTSPARCCSSSPIRRSSSRTASARWCWSRAARRRTRS